jgi:ADP-ribosyl-[dinitrogen reductase] hydrolase
LVLPRAELRERLERDFAYDLASHRALRRSRIEVSAMATVPPALSAVLAADNWEDAVRTVVCFGGDTDTVACIAGAVAEAAYGLPDSVATAARRYLTEDLRAVLVRFETALQLRK